MAVQAIPLNDVDISAEKVISSVLVSGVSNSMIDIVMNEIPEEFQNHTEIQSLLQQIQYKEREYLPLYRDWQNSGLLSEFHSTLFRLLGLFYVIGLLACLHPFLGSFALLGLLIIFGIFLYTRWQVLRGIKHSLGEIRQSLLDDLNKLLRLRKNLMQGKTA